MVNARPEWEAEWEAGTPVAAEFWHHAEVRRIRIADLVAGGACLRCLSAHEHGQCEIVAMLGGDRRLIETALTESETCGEEEELRPVELRDAVRLRVRNGRLDECVPSVRRGPSGVGFMRATFPQD